MGEQDQAAVERRLNEGEWLKIGDLIVLFGASRSSVDRWINKGARFGKRRMLIRYKIDPSGERLCMPDDIRAVLAESRKIRSADDPEGETGTTP